MNLGQDRPAELITVTIGSIQALIDGSALLKSLHTFFWNRWAIDAFYNRVFVGGTRRLATFVAGDLEDRWDRLVHRQLPSLFTERAQRLVHRLRTETEELVYNVSYVLVLFVLLLTFLLLRTGGG